MFRRLTKGPKQDIKRLIKIMKLTQKEKDELIKELLNDIEGDIEITFKDLTNKMPEYIEKIKLERINNKKTNIMKTRLEILWNRFTLKLSKGWDAISIKLCGNQKNLFKY